MKSKYSLKNANKVTNKHFGYRSYIYKNRIWHQLTHKGLYAIKHQKEEKRYSGCLSKAKLSPPLLEERKKINSFFSQGD